MKNKPWESAYANPNYRHGRGEHEDSFWNPRGGGSFDSALVRGQRPHPITPGTVIISYEVLKKISRDLNRASLFDFLKAFCREQRLRIINYGFRGQGRYADSLERDIAVRFVDRDTACKFRLVFPYSTRLESE